MKKTQILFLAAMGITLFFSSLAQAQGRVAAAHSEKDKTVRAMFAEKKMAYPPDEVFFRAFKYEPQTDHGIVELWARDGDMKEFVLINTYKICYASGDPGPKRREGDFQVPEGFYRITGWNPASSYHLSMRINYPNASDKILSDKRKPGGDIFIHGACASIGCLAMTNEKIRELYIIADDTRKHSGKTVQFHIFPRRMDERGMAALEKIAGGDKKQLTFWQNLKTGFDIFEKNHIPPDPKVDNKGIYVFK